MTASANGGAVAVLTRPGDADDGGDRGGRRRGRPVWLSGMLGVLLVVTALFVVVPVLFAVLLSVGVVGPLTDGFTWAAWAEIFARPGFGQAFLNTIGLAVTQQLIAMVVAIPIAWALARTDIPGKGWMEYAFWVAFFLPSLTTTLAWILILDSHNGWANQVLLQLGWIQNPFFDIYSWWGIVWIHLISGSVAIKVMLITPAFRNLDATMDEAARSCGANGFRTFNRISLRLIAPTVIFAVIFSTMKAIESFEVEYVLGLPAGIDVLPTLIFGYAQSSPPEYSAASAVSVILLVMMVPAVIWQVVSTSRRRHATVTGKFKGTLQPLGRWRRPVYWSIVALILVMTVVPVALVLLGTFMKFFGIFDMANPWTLDNWVEALDSRSFTHALMNTFVLATVVSLISMFAFSAIGYIIVRLKFRGRDALDFMVWLPSMTPGLVLGLSYVAIFLSVPFLRPLYGTVWILIIVAALSSLTLSVQLCKTALIQLGPELEEAAGSCGSRWLRTYWKVILPLMAPTVVVVGVVAFAGAARTTGVVALLSSGSNQPLSILQLNQMAAGDLEAASVVGVFILVLTLGVALIARLIGVDARGKM